jgi:hypothetical protein
MGVRPPSGDDSDPETIEFGIAVLDDVLADADVSFPADRETVVREIGDRSVPFNAAGNSVRLAEALADVGTDRFESAQALKNDLYPVFEELRETRGSGILGQLRALVPF